jgi:hypothetical protein
VGVVSHFQRSPRRVPRRSRVLAALAACFVGFSPSAWAQFSPCDLNQDGVVNSTDAALAVNMALGTTPCTANVEGPLTCTVITVQRVTNASLGETCITYNSHAVALTWVASSTPNVSYNVYRGAASAGPFTILNSSLISGLTYTDSAVQAGQTYYYVAAAADAFGDLSAYSNPPVQATIPNP